MKIKITVKDPDGVYESINEAVKKSVASIEGLEDFEREEMEESRTESVGEKLSKWIEYGEYITVEFDTETGEATVIPV
jgi:hypothetical protein